MTTQPQTTNQPSLPLQKIAYNRKEAAYLMSVSLRSLDYLTASGELPTRKVGGRTLITHTDIEKFFRRDHKIKPN